LAPLELVRCKNEACGLVQLRHTVNRDLLYREYWYQSGINQSMRDALMDVAVSATQAVKLNAGDIVVDIGSNDGTLIRHFHTLKGDLRIIGFEPAKNLALSPQDGAREIINDYFNYKDFALRFPNEKAKVVTSIAMFYDLDNPNVFVRDVKRVLANDGIWVIQMNCLERMLDQNAFDVISHEHLEYYSVSVLDYLVGKHGFEVDHVEFNEVNGGSMRAYVRLRKDFHGSGIKKFGS